MLLLYDLAAVAAPPRVRLAIGSVVSAARMLSKRLFSYNKRTTLIHNSKSGTTFATYL